MLLNRQWGETYVRYGFFPLASNLHLFSPASLYGGLLVIIVSLLTEEAEGTLKEARNPQSVCALPGRDRAGHPACSLLERFSVLPFQEAF